MLEYILKSAACMAIFLLFYKLLLEKETMHVFKRFFLLAALGLSLIIPAIVFEAYVEAPAQNTSDVQNTSETLEYIGVPSSLESDILDIEPLLWMVYSLGLVFFGLKFVKNLFQIWKRIRHNPKQKLARFTQVLLKEKMPPHTFFRYIFLNKKKLESNEIPKAVLLHEETHARQKHSWDVVFVELLQVIFWINPLIYILKKAIKLNHEFLADQAVLNKNIDQSDYQNTLLSYLSPDSAKKYQPLLANAINYSSIKKRFTVMKTHTSKKSVLIRSMLLLPLLALVLYGFTETKYVQREILIPGDSKTEKVQEKATPEMVAMYNRLAKKYNAQPEESRVIPLMDLKKLEGVFQKMSEKQKKNAQPFPECPPQNVQKGASRKLMVEYNKLAKYYNDMPRNSMKINGKDVERLAYIYSLMSEKQKADAETFPDFPPMPDPPKAPQPPKAVKGEKSAIPPPPPPAPNQTKLGNEIEMQEMATKKQEKAMKAQSTVRPPKPPQPPTPKTPLDHATEMAKQGAIFYYKNKKISSDEAIEILKENDDLSMDISRTNDDPPVVKIAKYLSENDRKKS